MRRAVKRSSKRAAHRGARQGRQALHRAHRALHVVHDEAGQPVLDHLGHGAVVEGDHRHAAGHGLDHHQPEGLRPVDREEQARARPTGTRAFSLVADLADELDMRLRQQRADLLVEVVAVGAVHLGRDLQRQAGSGRRSRSPGPRASRARCARGRRGRRAAAPVARRQQALRQAVMDGRRPVRPGHRRALRVGDRDQRHAGVRPVVRPDLRQVEPAVQRRDEAASAAA